MGLFCSCKDNKQAATKQVNTSKEVILYNWKEYTNLEVLKKFEAETGIKVILKEFENLDEMFGRLQSNPGFSDLIVADSHIAKSQYVSMKLISKLDKSKLKNTSLYVEHFQEFEETGVPYSFGITGFAFDKSKIKKEYSDYSFLSDPSYKGKISLLDDHFDLFLDLLVSMGHDINSDVGSDIEAKLDKLVNEIVLNDPEFDETFTNLDKLVEGSKWIVQTYSGDAIGYMEENENVEFIFNRGNYNAWSESICLVQNAPNIDNAYKLLNFLSKPENAAAFSNEFYYANGIKGSEEFMDEKVKNNKLINIPEETRKRGVFYLKSKDSNAIIQKVFAKLSSPKKNNSNEKED